MAKNQTTPTHTTIKTEGDNSSVHYHMGDNNPIPQKEKKPNWVVKAIVVAAIGLVCSIIVIYVKNSTAANGKPAYIQNGTPPEEKTK